MISDIIQRAIGRPPAPPADPDPNAQLAHLEQTIATAQQSLAALREQQVFLTEQLGDITARLLRGEANQYEHGEGDDRLQRLRDLDEEIIALEALLPSLYERLSTAQLDAKRHEQRRLIDAQAADYDEQGRVEGELDRLLSQVTRQVDQLRQIEARADARRQQLINLGHELKNGVQDPWIRTKLPSELIGWAQAALRELRRG
jgi:chromosome segregation ATPase